VDAPLREEWTSGRRGVARPGEASREALTRWTLREALTRAALLEVRLETGRQHQIRAHLAHAGLPILGDAVYGAPAVPGEREVAPRPLLHAWRLGFAHPVTGERVEVECPPPADFRRALELLRRRER
jgi:23S rRNA pseudouridine1911/1915/1917 synthase